MRWNPTGEKLVSASGDGTIQVVDFNAQKAIQTTTTLHDGKELSYLVSHCLWGY